MQTTEDKNEIFYFPYYDYKRYIEDANLPKEQKAEKLKIIQEVKRERFKKNVELPGNANIKKWIEGVEQVVKEKCQ